MATSITKTNASGSGSHNTTSTKLGDVGFTGDQALGLIALLTTSQERSEQQRAFAFQNVMDAGQQNLRIIADKLAPSKMSDVLPFVVVGAAVFGGIALLARSRR